MYQFDNRRSIPDLVARKIEKQDSIRICNFYPEIQGLRELPEWTKDCIVAVRDTDGIDYKSTIYDMVIGIKKILEEVNKNE